MKEKVDLEIKIKNFVIFILLFGFFGNILFSAFGKSKKGVEYIRFYYYKSPFGFYRRLNNFHAIEDGMDLPL